MVKVILNYDDEGYTSSSLAARARRRRRRRSRRFWHSGGASAAAMPAVLPTAGSGSPRTPSSRTSTSSSGQLMTTNPLARTSPSRATAGSLVEEDPMEQVDVTI